MCENLSVRSLKVQMKIEKKCNRPVICGGVHSL